MVCKMTDKIRDSFWGEPREITVNGPISLMRLAGRDHDGNINRPHGLYWFDECVFWDALDFATDRAQDPALQTLVLKTMLRQDLALLEKWNSMNRIYQMRVPSGKTFQAWFGRARYQNDPGNLNIMTQFLFGGEHQYVIDVEGSELEKFIYGPTSSRIRSAGPV